MNFTPVCIYFTLTLFCCYVGFAVISLFLWVECITLKSCLCTLVLLVSPLVLKLLVLTSLPCCGNWTLEEVASNAIAVLR